jgi:uncharacterized protein involved in response to NO
LLGVAILLMLISFIDGRIIPGFTQNWLVKQSPEIAVPASFGRLDRAALATTMLALLGSVIAPDGPVAPCLELAACVALEMRLARWRGFATWREPLLWVLHLGYFWLALGFYLLGLNGLIPLLPETAAFSRAYCRLDRHDDPRRD